MPQESNLRLHVRLAQSHRSIARKGHEAREANHHGPPRKKSERKGAALPYEGASVARVRTKPPGDREGALSPDVLGCDMFHE